MKMYKLITIILLAQFGNLFGQEPDKQISTPFEYDKWTSKWELAEVNDSLPFSERHKVVFSQIDTSYYVSVFKVIPDSVFFSSFSIQRDSIIDFVMDSLGLKFDSSYTAAIIDTSSNLLANYEITPYVQYRDVLIKTNLISIDRIALYWSKASCFIKCDQEKESEFVEIDESLYSLESISTIGHYLKSDLWLELLQK